MTGNFRRSVSCAILSLDFAGSVLLHAINVLLLWQLGRRLGLSAGAAFLAAAIFSVHFSISEAVHWINGRSDPMAILFLLGGRISRATFPRKYT